MPTGFQVFDASGNLQVDITDRLTRVIGQVSTGSAAGAISVPAWDGSYGTPWVFVQQRNQSADQFGKRTVSATISGTTLSWTFEPSTGPAASWAVLPAVIIYGVY